MKTPENQQCVSPDLPTRPSASCPSEKRQARWRTQFHQPADCVQVRGGARQAGICPLSCHQEAKLPQRRGRAWQEGGASSTLNNCEKLYEHPDKESTDETACLMADYRISPSHRTFSQLTPVSSRLSFLLGPTLLYTSCQPCPLTTLFCFDSSLIFEPSPANFSQPHPLLAYLQTLNQQFCTNI